MYNEQVSNRSQSVGTSNVTALNDLQGGMLRTTLVIKNSSTGAQKITLSFGQDATAGAGIVLNPGDTWCEALDPAYVPYQGPIYAIGDAANGSLAIHERTRGG